MTALAIEKGGAEVVAVIERLTVLKHAEEDRLAREDYFRALSALQADMPEIAKTKKVHDKHGKYRYSFAPLDAIVAQIKDVLKDHGFSYEIKTEQTTDSFTAICVSHHIGGHSESTTFTVPIDSEAYMSAPQKVGSARTFAMRYAFCDAFGILTSDADDDASSTDGSAAQSEGPKNEPEKERPVCPSCGKRAIIKGKPEYGGGWVCYKKLDGCGAKFPDGDPRFAEKPKDPVREGLLSRAWLCADSGFLNPGEIDMYRKECRETRDNDKLREIVVEMEKATELAEKRSKGPGPEGTPDNPDVTSNDEPDYSGAEEAFGNPKQEEIF